MAMTQAEKSAKAKAKRTAAKTKPDKAPTVAPNGLRMAFVTPALRSEFLTIAAGAVPLVYAELHRKSAQPPPWQAAVDAVLAEADRRWPR